MTPVMTMPSTEEFEMRLAFSGPVIPESTMRCAPA